MRIWIPKTSRWQLVPLIVRQTFLGELTEALRSRWVVFPLIFFNQLLALALPLLFGKFISLYIPYDPYRGRLIPGYQLDWGLNGDEFALVLVGLALLRGLTEWGARYQKQMIATTTSFQLQRFLFQGQLLVPYSEYQTKGIGRYLLRWSGDLISMQQLISHGLIQLVADMVLIGGGTVLILWFFPPLGVGLMGLALFSVGMAVLYQRLIHPYSVRYRNSRSRLLNHVSQRLRTIEMVQVFNRFDPEEKRFDNQLKRVFDRKQTYLAWREGMRGLSNVYLWIFVIGITWSTFQAGPDIITASLPVIFLLVSMTAPFRRMLKVGIILENGRISLEKVAKLIPNPGRSYDKPRGEKSLQIVGLPVPSDPDLTLNFTLLTNGIHLCTLPSASDSQWILQQVVGQAPLANGEVLWDGIYIQRYEPRNLRKRFSIVSPRYGVLGRTVFEAISYSRNSKRKKKAQTWLTAINQLLPVEQRLHLDDRIGELGADLTLAQKQLLGYARAFLTRKPFLVLESPWYGLNAGQRASLLLLLKDYSAAQGAVILVLDPSNYPLPKQISTVIQPILT